MLESCQSKFHILLCRFSLNTPFLFEINCADIPGGAESCIQITLIRPFILRLVLLLMFKFSHPHFERACSARQPDIGSTSFLCATYHANNSLNCARIAIFCRMREVCEKTRLGRNNCELIGSKTTSQSREISQ